MQDPGNFIKISQQVFEQEINELCRVSNNIGTEINEIVELINDCKGKIVVTGIGKTGLIGRKIAASLASTGLQAVFMNAFSKVETVEGEAFVQTGLFFLTGYLQNPH